MTRYGIVGFGNHGIRRLVPGFAGAKASVLAGMWRRDAEKAQANARQFGIEHVFASAEELCASPEIDAVFVASPDALHLDHTQLAFAHHKPVLCEKPLAMNAPEVEQMLADARNAGVLFGVAQNFRYNRSVNLVRDWVHAGRIGKPLFATAQFCFTAEGSPRKWIYDPSLACGGPIGDVGVHCIDALRFILEDNVAAVTTIAHSDKRSAPVEARAALALDFTRGTIGSVLVTFRAEYRTYVEIIGEAGMIQSENCFSVDRPVRVVLERQGEIIDTEDATQVVSNSDAYSLMLDAFSAALSGSGTYAAPGDDALNNQRTLDAAYASWRSGRKEIVAAG